MALTAKATKSVYDLYEIDVSDLLETDPEAEHAGELETSLMLHLTPELVRTDAVEEVVPEVGALRKYTHRRVPKPHKRSKGVVGTPALATPEKGAAIFERYVSRLVATLGPSAGTPP